MNEETRQKMWGWIADRRKEKLRFGVFDCCTLCADYLIDIHGKPDLIKTLRGKYKTRAQAFAVLKKHGGMQKMVAKRLGEMQPMTAAQAGAIVLGDFGEGDAVGICTGTNIACVGENGLVFSALSCGKGCWPL